MKTIVVYESKTGFTKEYGTWIGEQLGCKVVSRKESKKLVEDYDVIIYGGGILAGKISGFEKFKNNPKLLNKTIILFGTGATPSNNVVQIEKLKQANLTPEEEKAIPFFYMESGIRYEKLGFITRKFLKMMFQSIEKKEQQEKLKNKENKMEVDCNQGEEIKTMTVSFEHMDKKYVDPLVEWVKNL